MARKLFSNLDAQSVATVVNLPLPTSPGDAASKEYVDQVASESRAWKEILLDSAQLVDGASGAVAQAIAFFLTGQPSAGDTFIIDDGTTTETFTFVATESVAFDVEIGASVDDTMANLATAISDDSTLWDAVRADGLDSINDGSGSGTAGKVVIIHRTAQSAASFDDRIYGSLTTQSDGQYINFNGETDYEKSATVDLPSADPAQKEFGFGREFASLVNNETHTTRDEDAIFTWDADAQVWQNTGTGSITAGVALEKVGSTLNVLVDGSTITTNGSNELTLVAGVAFADHKFAADIGDGVTNPINVNHALGSTDVIVQVYENSSGDQIDIDIEVIDANNIEIETNPGQIPGSNELRVVVLG